MVSSHRELFRRSTPDDTIPDKHSRFQAISNFIHCNRPPLSDDRIRTRTPLGARLRLLLNQNHPPVDSTESRTFGRAARYPESRQRMAVMRGDDIVVGHKSPTRKSPHPIVGHLGAPDQPSSPTIDRPRNRPGSRPSVCGEMSQQCGNSGAQSTPQKFLRLVGCRDPNAGPSVKR